MAIYKRGGVWWMDVYAGAPRKRIRRSTGCTDETDARIVEQTMLGLNRGVTPKARAMAIIDAVLPEKARGLPVGEMSSFYARRLEEERCVIAEKERKGRVKLLGVLAEWLRENSTVRTVDGITPEVAWQFTVALGRSGAKARTVNNKIGLLSAAWKTFVRSGFAERNPWGEARMVRNREEEKSGRAFTDEEVDRILAACREVGCEWEGVATVALYTGLRLHDIESLRWSEVDVAAGEIVKAPSKTKRRGIVVRVPLHERLAAMLEVARANAASGEEFVFPFRASHFSSGGWRRDNDVAFREVLRMAGIEEKGRERLTFHSLRHTFVTRLAEAGVAEDVRMRLAGHTNAATHAIYTHGDARAREAIGRLG